MEENRAKIEKGLEALANGDYVTGTSKELYEQAIKRSRERLKNKPKS